jgi:hypothetical protein
MSNISFSTLLRTAAVAAILVAPALAGCAADGSRVAMTGSSLPGSTWHSSSNPSDAYGPVNLSIAH